MPDLRQEVLKLESLWSARDLADYFQVPESSVIVAADRGAIPGCTKAMGRYVFDRDVAVAGWKPAQQVIVELGPITPTLPRESEEHYLTTLVDVTDTGRWRAICDRAIEQAVGGDRHARDWLSGYLMGRPLTRIASQSVTTHQTEFSEADRAAVVLALLKAAKKRDDQSSEPEPDREGPDRRTGSEQATVDASS